MKHELNAILELIFELNAKGHHSFFDFTGHVSGLYVAVCDGKWEEGKPFAYEERIYLDEQPEALGGIAAKLADLLANLKI